MTSVTSSTPSSSNWFNNTSQPPQPASEQNSGLAASTGCPLYDHQSDVVSGKPAIASASTGRLRQMLPTDNTTRGFMTQLGLPPCPHEKIGNGDETQPGKSAEVDDAMKNRIEAYKKMIDEVEFIVGSSKKPGAKANPLTVRAWFYNIGLAFGKVKLVMKSIEEARCASREERIEKVLEVFRQNDIMVLAGNAIRARQPAYSEDAAKEKAEELVRYAYNNSITK